MAIQKQNYRDTLFILFFFMQCILMLHAVRTVSDSILDLINTKGVERLIAERKENEAKEERRYLAQNELDENYELLPETERQELLYQQPDSDTNVYNKPATQPDRPPPGNPRIGIDVLLRQNHSDPYRNTELLNELRGFNGRKVLKSSKNALLVTRKEYLKRDWCKTEPLIQKIKEDGCLTRTIINRFCYGQCNSFYIPKNPKRRSLKHGRMAFDDEDEDNDLNGAAFKSCAFCKPKKFTWITITLRCPTAQPHLRKKRIQRIKQCKCITEVLN